MTTARELLQNFCKEHKIKIEVVAIGERTGEMYRLTNDHIVPGFTPGLNISFSPTFEDANGNNDDQSDA